MVMKDVRDRTSEILDSTTLADVEERIREAAATRTEVLDYVI
jgi:DNA-binding IscR family transcriptional regulator